MDEAVAEELRLGESMMDDVRRQADVLHQMASSLLLFDTKRKRLESHFDSLVELIQRKQTEAVEAIRVKEHEAKARVERLRDEKLEDQEKIFKSIIKVKINELEDERKRLQNNAAEMEREVTEAKMDTDRMAVELCKKERELRQAKIDAERIAMEVCQKKKEVDDLTARIREDARIGVTCKRLTAENIALREEVKSLTKELEKQEIRFNDVLKVKMKEVAEEREKIERLASKKELEKQEKRFNDHLKVKLKEVAEEKEKIERLAAKKELEKQEKRFIDLLKVKMKEVAEEKEKIERLAAKKELEKQEKRFNDLLKVKMKEVADEKEKIERLAAKKELEKQEKRFNDLLKVKMKEVAEEKEKIERQAAEKELEKQEKRYNDLLKVKIKEVTEEREKIERQAAEKELAKQEKRFNDLLKVKMKELADERERIERGAAEKEKGMRDAKMEKERMIVELCEKEKDVNRIKKTVAELTARMQHEGARLDAVGRALSDENLALREQVKSLTHKLELKSHPLKREEQLSAIQSFLQNMASAGIITLCDTIKHPDPSWEDLFKIAQVHIDDHEVATLKVISALQNAKDKAQDLVTEALRFSYKAELEDPANESKFRACRIFLLEQLSRISPQVASQTREEARKVAVEWIAKLDDCADKVSEISRFLRFLSSYDVASEFEDEVLVPILYNSAVHEGTPDLCFTLGFEDRIAGFTKTLLTNSQRLKALEYVSAFKLEKFYSVGKIVHEEMNHINQTCHNMLKEGGQDRAPEVMNFEIDSLRELIKRIKDLKCEGKYATVNLDLEQRLVKLEKKKYFFKRSADKPSPSSEDEPSRKKICNPSGTSKQRESDPKDTVNVHPPIGSRDICCSKPCSDSESLMMKGHILTGTTRSTEMPPKDTLYVLQKSGSRDLCYTNPTCDHIPISKEACQLATISQSIESASSDILNVHPDSGFKALCCSNSSIDPKPSRKEENCQPIESASNDILNLHPGGEPAALCFSTSSTNHKPSMKAECQLPGTTQSLQSASNDTRNVNIESGSRSGCHSNPSKIPKRSKPRRKKGAKLLGTATSTKVVPKVISDVNPRSGSVFSRHLHRSPKPWNKTGCNFPRTAKSGSYQKQASNAFLDIGSRNAHQSQEMQGALTHPTFHYGVISRYIFPSPQTWYEPQDFPPPQYYQTYPSFE